MFVLILGLVLAAVPSALSQFSNPKPGNILTIGGQISVTYKTKLDSYTIALWQQAPEGGAANLGPVLSNVTDGPASSFDWKINVGRLDLTYSTKFFLWMFPNGYAQGNQSAPNQMSSGYFTIIERTPDPTTTSSGSTTASTATATTTSSSSMATTAGTPTSGPDSQQPETSDQGLSTGAKAGIGVGVGVGALAIIALCLLFLRYKSAKDAEIQELRNGMQDKPFAGNSSSTHHHQPAYYQPGVVYQPPPVEMG